MVLGEWAFSVAGLRFLEFSFLLCAHSSDSHVIFFYTLSYLFEIAYPLLPVSISICLSRLIILDVDVITVWFLVDVD